MCQLLLLNDFQQKKCLIYTCAYICMQYLDFSETNAIENGNPYVHRVPSYRL